MSAITIPEVVIYHTLEAILKFLRDDIKVNDEAGTPKESVMYHLLGETDEGKSLTMNAYNFYEQAKAMLTNKTYLKVNYGYNAETAKNLALHIIMPSESYAGSGIGEDEGYQTDLSDNLPDRFTQNFEANYQIMITSDNSTEVMVIYHLLKSMFIAVVPHWELMGIRIPKFSGSDIVFESDFVPFTLFHKVLNITFMYEHTVPQLVKKRIVTGITFEGTPLDYIYK